MSQDYVQEASNAYVIVGNSALIKCEIPSFVSDFVEVVGWEDSEGGVHARDAFSYGTTEVPMGSGPALCSGADRPKSIVLLQENRHKKTRH